MNTSIKVISGPVGEGRTKSSAQFPKTSADSILKCEKPAEIFLSQATFQINLSASQSNKL